MFWLRNKEITVQLHAHIWTHINTQGKYILMHCTNFVTRIETCRQMKITRTKHSSRQPYIFLDFLAAEDSQKVSSHLGLLKERTLLKCCLLQMLSSTLILILPLLLVIKMSACYCYVMSMGRSRKFCQRGSNFDNIFFL